MMIERAIKDELLTQLNEYSIVTVLGPRKSGKTTLVRHTLPGYQYVSMENPESRQIATDDLNAFLRQFPGKTIFDEVQRAPHLLSYLQGIVDTGPSNW